MTVFELSQQMASGELELTLLDVRTPQERAIARIEPSILIPLQELPYRLYELDDWQQKPLVVYCHHGVRSDYAVRFLAQAGFTQVYNLEGGIDHWSISIDPSIPRY